MPSKSKTINIAIFDLTDCEGCEIRFIDLKEELYELLKNVRIVNWRLATDIEDPGPYDISFIEGTPLSKHEVAQLKLVRERSSMLIALGACACLGGVQAGIYGSGRYLSAASSGKTGISGNTSKSDNTVRSGIIGTPSSRRKGYVPPAPLSHFVNVDLEIPGCPVDTNILKYAISSLVAGKRPSQRSFPVCMDCRERENNCVMLSGTLCLGPVTLGGCGAICVTEGRKCFGCYGPIKDANYDALYTAAGTMKIPRKDVGEALDLFLSYRRKI